MHIPLIVGAALILFLGVSHAVFTIQSTADGGPMMPTNPDTRAAMQVPGSLGLAPHAEGTLYRAWLGFNYSHSIAVIGGGLYLGLPALLDFDGALRHPAWIVGAIVLPLIYVMLARLYWFADVVRMIGIATVLILVGIIGGLIT